MLPPLFHGHTMMVNHSISSVLGPISSSKALINPHTLRHRPRTCCCLDHLSCIPGLGVERSAAHGHIQKCSFCCSFCSMANLKNQLCLILKCSFSKKVLFSLLVISFQDTKALSKTCLSNSRRCSGSDRSQNSLGPQCHAVEQIPKSNVSRRNLGVTVEHEILQSRYRMVHVKIGESYHSPRCGCDAE